MSDFPSLLKESAERWSSECSAFEQLRIEGGALRLRLQAIEIMQQFVGDVNFGRDPKGLLFYNSQGDFDVGLADFRYWKHGTGPIVTIQTDFHEVGLPTPFARFIARVDTTQYRLPQLAAVTGQGDWSPFEAALTQTRVVRVHGSTRLNLRFMPIRKRVYFDVGGTGRINSTGVLIFRDIGRLQRDQPNGQPLIADYASDRVVFRARGDHSDRGVAGLVSFASVFVNSNYEH
ncbi:hypothetical protein BJV74DRAFT_857028 [Russula compacta]|nr:hypothetical protein BJV74DRAFT_857028 [Russula compacta]